MIRIIIFSFFLMLINLKKKKKNIKEKIKLPKILYKNMFLCLFSLLPTNYTYLRHMAGNEGNQEAKQRKGN